MSAKLNWNKAKLRNMPVLSLTDEFERRATDAAARWLAQHKPVRKSKKRRTK